jgi:hypothetical protein
MELFASALHEDSVLLRCRGRHGPRKSPQWFDETDPGYIFTSLGLTSLGLTSIGRRVAPLAAGSS